MKLSAAAAVIVVALVVVLGSKLSSAQYEEICHYECGIVYCDPYTDYCDYDCYEVCYPYRSSQANSRFQVSKVLGVKTFRSFRSQTTTTQAPVAQHGSNSNGNGRTGKGVRMRMQRVPRLPSNGANRQAKEFSRPENFALFESCL